MNQKPAEMKKVLLKPLIKNRLETDRSGALVLRYGKGFFVGLSACFLLLLFGLLLSPPASVENWLIATLLIGGTLYSAIQARYFQLFFIDGIILRNSPWPWHKNDRFVIQEVTAIDINFRNLHVCLKMQDSKELAISFFLNGAFWLLSQVIQNPQVKISNRERTLIEHYAKY